MEIVRELMMPLDREGAFQRQLELAAEVTLSPPDSAPALIGAVDVAYSKDDSETAYAAVVVLDKVTLEVVDRAGWVGPTPFGYTPGLFALREAFSLLEAFKLLETRPDVIIVDGHGVAHPRRFGLACHLGLTLGVPTIGAAKKRLCGDVGALASQRGSRTPILLDGSCVGYALRTQTGIKPVFVSPGDRYDAESAAELIIEISGEYRIPEPQRQAHNFSVELRAGRSEAS